MGGNVFEGQRRGEVVLGQLKICDFREMDFFWLLIFFFFLSYRRASTISSFFLSLLFLISGYVNFSSEIFIGVEGGSCDSASDFRRRSLSF